MQRRRPELQFRPPACSAVPASGSGAPRQSPEAAPRLDTPRRADGLELIGPYAGSGLRNRAYLVRRADGQMLQLPELLYLVTVHADGGLTLTALADRLSAETGRRVTAEAVGFMVRERLRPAGLLASGEGPGQPTPRADPLLAVRLRMTVLTPPLVRRITSVFRPLFASGAMMLSAVGLVAFDAWMFLGDRLNEGFRQLGADPAAIVLIAVLAAGSVVFHELGHATGCRYGGAEPGAIGAGVFVVWPALFTDLTDTYRLGRGGRLRADLGGIYFNALFALAAGTAYLLSGFEPLLVLVMIQHLEMATQSLPLLRLDGYYVLSDLTGVPDLLSRVRPTLLGLLPSRRGSRTSGDLRPWVRWTVVAYAAVTIPALIAILTATALNVPAMLDSAATTVSVEAQRLMDAWGAAEVGHLVVASAGALIAVLPIAGMAITVALVTRRLLKASRRPLRAARPAFAAGGDVLWSASVGLLVVYASFYLTVGGTGPGRAPLLALIAAVLLTILLVAGRIGRLPGGAWDRRLRAARERRGF